MARERAAQIREVLAKNLKRLVLKEYRSIESFALQNRINNSALSRLINGERTPRVETLVDIAEALEVTLNDLYPIKANQGKRKAV